MGLNLLLNFSGEKHLTVAFAGNVDVRFKTPVRRRPKLFKDSSSDREDLCKSTKKGQVANACPLNVNCFLASLTYQ